MVVTMMMAGCVRHEPKIITLNSTFNPQDAAYIFEKGDNTIKGQSFLKTQGGDVKTCAGNKAHLVPVTDYATERMVHIYNNHNAGYSPMIINMWKKFESTDQDYLKYSRETYCDAGGNFNFENIPDGEYYITTFVTWRGGYPVSIQGGYLMKRISVSGGGTKTVYVLGE